MYHVVRFDDGGETLTILDSYYDEENANDYYDLVTNKHPNAYIDVLTDEEL